MKTFITVFSVLFLSCSFLRANSPSETKTIFSKKDIQSLAPQYINNNVKVKNPIIVDVDNYEINSFLPKMLIPIFFADNDGDKDVDVFGIVSKGYDRKTLQEKYDVVQVENTAFFDNYTLITIILVLLIIALILVII